MKTILTILFAATLMTACGSNYLPVATTGYTYMNPTPVRMPVRPYPAVYDLPVEYQTRSYYCFRNGFIERSHKPHPKFKKAWMFAPYVNCI